MLAYHPKTGKEVRVITTDYALSKTHRTLIYGAPTPGSKNLYTYCTKAWDARMGTDYNLLLTPISSEDLKLASESCRMIVASKAALVDVSPLMLKNMRIRNIIVLEEFNLLYPHLGGPWDSTEEDAVVLLAGLLRIGRIHGIEPCARSAALGIQVLRTAQPEKLWWITQIYQPEKPKRRKELQRALEINANSKLIDRILLLNEKPEKFYEAGKVPIDEVVIGHRLTYADVFREILSRIPPGVICVFANADIAIDDKSWQELWEVNLENKFLALLRYDVPESGRIDEAQIFGPRPDSQDTWVVRSDDVLARGPKILEGLDFQFGQMGCDNAIALDMLRRKFQVSNPALSIKTWHFHSSGVRGYDATDILERPMFHYVQPTGISDMRPLINPDGCEAVIRQPLTCLVRGGGGEAWARAANLFSEQGWRLDSPNVVSLGKEYRIPTVKNCFQTPEGVVFNQDSLFVGPTKTAAELWSKVQIQPFAATMESQRALVSPWPSKANTREAYMLKYLSKVLRLGAGEFFALEDKSIENCLQIFKWPGASQPVLKWEEDGYIWCREASVFLPPESSLIGTEDIAALRAAVQGWQKDPLLRATGGRLRLVIMEGVGVSEQLSQSLEDVLERAFDVKIVYPGRTSPERMLDCLRGAWGVVCGPGIVEMGWNWMLPVGARVFEIGIGRGREEIEAGILLSAASGLEHRFCSVQKDEILKEIFEEEKSWVEAAAGAAAADDIPVLHMPRRDLTGYFSHPGDSFRQLARLWAKRGFCRVVEHATATMVWWGSVGKDGVLLYDRPTHDWRLAAPLVEKEWRFGLFGNPRPPAGKPASPWIFWARMPEMLEELVLGAGLGGLGWSERQPGAVFYGKIENKVQEKRRALPSGADWSSACREFVMAGPSEPHKYTHAEYYEKLANARYGLCLAGYGFKCHREVECMALGVVPICAPDVDMESYAVPPREGTHYFRASTPEDVRRLVETTPQEIWESMSAACRAWWRENCSAEGSFKLTRALISKAEQAGKNPQATTE